MNYDAQKWLKQFNENYEGVSEEAKSLEGQVENIKDAQYIPWAIMERLMYRQDPSAFTENLTNENGGLVFTDEDTVYTKDATGEYFTTWQSHTVRVSCTFLGKTIIEDYPVQEVIKGKGYVATKFIDASMVNKALQRAKAKVISRNTGIAFKLYEGNDLQFEPDIIEKENSDNTKKEKDITKFKIPEPEISVDIQENPEVAEDKIDKSLSIASFFFKNKEKIIPVLQRMNTKVASSYGFVFDLTEDSLQTVAEHLNKIRDKEVFTKAVLTQAGFGQEQIKKLVE